VADERDVIGLRTNYRKDPPEDVYLYRLQGDKDNVRRLFLEYVKNINELQEKPVFYNTLLDNCTTAIWFNTRVNPSHLPFSWKILLSGYLPYEQLQRKANINKLAKAANKMPDFSQRIREGIVKHN
jgi:hypothetical protein